MFHKALLLFLVCVTFSSCAVFRRDYPRPDLATAHPLLSRPGIGIQMKQHQVWSSYEKAVMDLKPRYVRNDLFVSNSVEHNVKLANIARRAGAVFIFTVKTGQPDEPGGSLHGVRDWRDYPALAENVRALADFEVIYELGNEPDGEMPVEQYLRWAIPVAEVIESVSKDPCIVAPAAKDLTAYEYIHATVVALGDRLDGISAHAYYRNPAGSENDYKHLRKAASRAGRKGMPYIVSESGTGFNSGDIDDAYRQSFVPLMYAIAMRQGASGWVLYEMQGDAKMPLLDKDRQATPLYETFRMHSAPGE